MESASSNNGPVKDGLVKLIASQYKPIRMRATAGKACNVVVVIVLILPNGLDALKFQPG